jgi:hypothetical protein
LFSLIREGEGEDEDNEWIIFTKIICDQEIGLLQKILDYGVTVDFIDPILEASLLSTAIDVGIRLLLKCCWTMRLILIW